ncbi:beta/alpha barrel domain-containing protein [Arthrobacter pigmenti]
MNVTITDVTLRDGFQDLDVVVGTAEKVDLATMIVDAGIPRLEVASFVNPARVPQMADADAVVDATSGLGATRVALTLNSRGVGRAVASEVEDVLLVTSASQAHSSANAGATIGETMATFADQVRAYPSATFSAGISTSFICPFEGDIPADRVVRIVEGFRDAGVLRVGLADTLGITYVDQVMATVNAVQEAVPEVTLSLHLHDAKGQALDTAIAAVEAGISEFDAALAGYGGCPFAPGAHGNVALESLVAHLHAAGHNTGIDEALVASLAQDARRLVAMSPAVKC